MADVIKNVAIYLINKFGGDFIKNLNTNQLKVSILSGNVTLNNLELQENVLETFGIPVRIKAGCVSKLSLNIPFNINKHPIVVKLDGLYALVVPSSDMNYDDEKSRKAAIERKLKDLSKIEEQRTLKQKDDDQKDSMFSSYIQAAIKGLEVQVTNVHLRYEDKGTTIKSPVSIGISLSSFTAQSCNSSWEPIPETTSQFIFKMVELEGMCLYFNYKQKLFSVDQEDNQEIIDRLNHTVATKDYVPEDFTYLIKPIFGSAKICAVPEPTLHLDVPQVSLEVIMKEFAVNVTNKQASLCFEVMNSLQTMAVKNKFRKFNPPEFFERSNASEWWRYSYRCVVDQVRSRMNKYNVNEIMAFRKKSKAYQYAYKRMLQKHKLTSEEEMDIKLGEEDLDIFNLDLARRLAERNISREEKLRKEVKKNRGWGGWFSSSTTVNEEVVSTISKITANSEDRAELYKAIGYDDGNVVDYSSFPKDYIAVKVNFILSTISLQLIDDNRNIDVCSVYFSHIDTDLIMRPSSNNVCVNASLQTFSVTGVRTSDDPPISLVSMLSSCSDCHILKVEFEIKPLNTDTDYRIKMESEGLEIVYDYNTVQRLLDFVLPPDRMIVEELKIAASSNLQKFRQASAISIMSALERKKIVDISVDIQPSFALVPYKGQLTESCSLVAFNLGAIKISSKNIVQEFSSTASFEEMQKYAYSDFNVDVSQIQVLLLYSSQNWLKKARTDEACQLIEPISFTLLLQKSIILRDSRFPTIKVSGSVNSLCLSLNDKQLYHLSKFLKKLPFPKPTSSGYSPIIEEISSPYVQEQAVALNDKIVDAISSSPSAVPKSEATETEQLTDLFAKFYVERIGVMFNKVGSDETIKPLVRTLIHSVTTSATIRSWDIIIDASLQSFELEYQRYDEEDKPIQKLRWIDASSSSESDSLLRVNFVKVNTITAPNFEEFYKNCEHTLKINFSLVNVLLHQDAFLELATIYAEIIANIDFNYNVTAPTIDTSMGVEKTLQIIEKRSVNRKIIIFSLDTSLQAISVAIQSDKANISNMTFEGLSSHVQVQKESIKINMAVKSTEVLDPSSDALYKKIVTFSGGDVFNLAVDVYPTVNATKSLSVDDCNMAIKFTTGRLKFVFLYKYIMTLLNYSMNFANNFQNIQNQLMMATNRAKESAVYAVKSIHENSSRIKLDVSVTAPLIIVPKSSSSREALMANLGQLNIKNFFQKQSVSSSTQSVFNDVMSLAITDVMLSRCLINSDGDSIEAECRVVEPLSMEITLKRNLSPWYKEIPTFEIGGSLNAFKAAVGPMDIRIIFGILNGNMNQNPEVSSNVTLDTVVVAESPSQISEMSANTELQEDTSQFLKFSFAIKEISLLLDKEDLSLLSGLHTRNPKYSLAKLCLDKVNFDGSIFTNQIKQFTVSLENCYLDDIRPQNTAEIKRMLTRSLTQSSDGDLDQVNDDFMFLANFNLNPFKRMNEANIVLNHVYICFCLEFLMTVSELFTANIEQPPNKQSDPISAGDVIEAQEFEQFDENQIWVSRMRVKIQKSEILLLSDYSNPQALTLLLRAALDSDITFISNQMSFSGMVTGLQIVSCPYDPKYREGRTKTVLLPCDARAFVKKDPTPRIDVVVPSLSLFISPVVMKIFADITTSLTQQRVLEEEEVKPVSDDIWKAKSLLDDKKWYLAPKSKSSIQLHPLVINEKPKLSERMHIDINNIDIRVDISESTRSAQPVIAVQSSLRADVNDWSSNLSAKCNLEIEAAYLNDELHTWEPLLERVEEQDKTITYPIAINLENKIVQTSNMDDSAKPTTFLEINSRHMLNITITKKFLQVAQDVQAAFSELTMAGEKFLRYEESAPYRIENHTGYSVKVSLPQSLSTSPNVNNIRSPILNKDESLDLYPIIFHQQKLFHRKSLTLTSALAYSSSTRESSETGLNVKIQVNGFDVIEEVSLDRSVSRLVSLYPDQQVNNNNNAHSIVLATRLRGSQTLLQIRSPLSIRNEFSVPLAIYQQTNPSLGSAGHQLIGTVDAHSQYFVGLDVAYSNPCKLYLAPTSKFQNVNVQGDYLVSSDGLDWREIRSSGVKSKDIACPKVSGGSLVITAEFIPDVHQFVKGFQIGSPIYSIHLKPSISITNLIPYTLKYSIGDEKLDKQLEYGQKTVLYEAHMGMSKLFIQLLDQQGRKLEGVIHLVKRKSSVSSFSLAYADNPSETFLMGIFCDFDSGYQNLSFFSPYWIINKLSRDVQLMDTTDRILKHPKEFLGVSLFSFSTFNANGKAKVTLKVDDSSWSSRFSMDAAGSTGVVECKGDQGQLIGVAVESALSYSGLTKLIILTPYYIICNNTEHLIAVLEKDVSRLFALRPNSVTPFWPQSGRKKLQIALKFNECTTQEFDLGASDEFLLRIPFIGGVMVDISISDSTCLLTINNYYSGAAPVEIVNDTNDAITYFQAGFPTDVHKIEEQTTKIVTWENSLDKQHRGLHFKYPGAKNVFQVDTLRNFLENFVANGTTIFVISFLDGGQRVLLFTTDFDCNKQFKDKDYSDTRFSLDMELKLRGIGMSLVNNLQSNPMEIAYMAVTSSDIIWEYMRPGKSYWEKFTIKHALMMETAYQRYIRNDQESIGEPDVYTLDDKVHKVDFSTTPATLLHPEKRDVRRSYLDGIYFHYKSSSTVNHIHAKINRIQLDNQMPVVTFRTVFSPVSVPEKFLEDVTPKPIAELSLIVKKAENSNVLHFPYIHFLMQEWALKIDWMFIGAIQEFALEVKDQEKQGRGVLRDFRKRKNLEKDLQYAMRELKDTKTVLASMETVRNYYDFVHFGPMKVYISFSLSTANTAGNENKAIAFKSSFFNLLVQSFGVTLTEIQDVDLKLNFFESQNTFMTQSQFMSSLIKHYRGQALAQVYKILLGLDVIGNPFGLVRGVKDGAIDLFYEPYRGAIQGPSEFVQGLGHGMKSLVTHSVGGVFGGLSSITGSFGKGIATLSLDEEHKQKRMQDRNRKPANIHEGVIGGFKAVGSGFAGAVSGVFTKPVSGMKKEGLKGAVTGMGVGIVGLVAKPVGGIADGVSNVLEGVAGITQEGGITQMRPPRLVRFNTTLCMYRRTEAEGNYMLMNVSDGKYASTDAYRCHGYLDERLTYVLLVTDMRSMFLEKGDIIDQVPWIERWALSFADLIEKPYIDNQKGICLKTKTQSAGIFSSSKVSGKGIKFQNCQFQEWICKQLQSAYSDYLTRFTYT